MVLVHKTQKKVEKKEEIRGDLTFWCESSKYKSETRRSLIKTLAERQLQICKQQWGMML
jgi:hypothetical protein